MHWNGLRQFAGESPFEGECRKRAPFPVDGRQRLMRAYWPHTTRDDWCGAWSPAPSASEGE